MIRNTATDRWYRKRILKATKIRCGCGIDTHLEYRLRCLFGACRSSSAGAISAARRFPRGMLSPEWTVATVKSVFRYYWLPISQIQLDHEKQLLDCVPVLFWYKNTNPIHTTLEFRGSYRPKTKEMKNQNGKSHKNQHIFALAHRISAILYTKTMHNFNVLDKTQTLGELNVVNKVNA